MSLLTKENIDYKCNIITIGDSTVGKTSILSTYVGNKNPLKQVSTVGIDYFTKDFEINKKIIRVKIWDTAGQERYRSITDSFYKSSHGILLVFDISSRDTFNNLKIWIQTLNLKVKTSINKILIGNKCDLERNVSNDEAESFGKEYDLKYFETSAKENKGIKEVFDYLITKIYQSGELIDQNKENEDENEKEKEKNKKVCLIEKSDSLKSKKKKCCK